MQQALMDTQINGRSATRAVATSGGRSDFVAHIQR